VLSFPVKAGSNSVTMPIPAAVLTGSYFAGLTLVCQQPDYSRSFALLRLSVEQQPQHLLKVSLEVPAIATPGATIDYRLKVHSPAGQPRPAAVHLFAVDEGILALTDYQTPDIFAFFHGQYYCHFQFSDIYDQIYPDLKIGADGTIGGGADNVRNSKLQRLSQGAPAIVNLGLLTVPPSGSLDGTLTLPEHLGALRLMAIASNPEAVGRGEAQIIQRDVISVTGTAPRAVAPLDEFEMTFTLFNHALPGGPATLKVTLPENWSRLSADSFTTVLDQGGSQSYRVKCQIPATAAGNFLVGYEFSLGTARKKGQLPLTVRPLHPPLTTVSRGSVNPGENKTICSALGQSWPRLDAARLRVLSSPLLGVEQALLWLNDYPYGCLEQITAGAFPFLAGDDLLRAGLISQEEKNQARQKLQRSITRILSLQTGNGQFTMWPGGYRPWAEASIFASHFLFLANAQQLCSLPWQTAVALQENLERCANDRNRPRAERGYALLVSSYHDPSQAAKIARKFLNR